MEIDIKVGDFKLLKSGNAALSHQNLRAFCLALNNYS